MHIVAFQLNACEQLPMTLGQARASFPNATLTVIGNQAAGEFLWDRIRDSFTYDFVNMDELPTGRLDDFRKCYRHLHTNSFDFEDVCLARWYYLKNWMDVRGVDECVYVDSDILLFSSADARLFGADFPKDGCALVIKAPERRPSSPGVSGHVSRWTRVALGRFCDFVIDSYQDGTKRKCLEDEWARQKLTQLPGGIGDMSMLGLFQAERNDVENLFQIKGNTFFDDSMHTSNGPAGLEFEMRHGMKKVTWANGSPRLTLLSCPPTLVEAAALHFQGVNKPRMPEYYRGPKLHCPVLRTLRKKIKMRVKRVVDQICPGSRSDVKALESELRECKKLIKELSCQLRIMNEKDGK